MRDLLLALILGAIGAVLVGIGVRLYRTPAGDNEEDD
jgi:hypothetical protein